MVAFLRHFLWAYASARLMASHYGIQESLLAAVAAEEWFDGSANQAMRFGGFPDWAEDLAEDIRTHFDCEQARSCSCTLFRATDSHIGNLCLRFAVPLCSALATYASRRCLFSQCVCHLKEAPMPVADCGATTPL